MYHSIIQHTQVLPYIILVSYGRFQNTSRYTMQHHISYIGRCLLNFLLIFQSLSSNTNLTTPEFLFSTSLFSTVDNSSCFIIETWKSICDVKHVFIFIFLYSRKRIQCIYQYNAMPTFHHIELRQLNPAYDKSWSLQSKPPINLLYFALLYIFFLVLNGGKPT